MDRGVKCAAKSRGHVELAIERFEDRLESRRRHVVAYLSERIVALMPADGPSAAADKKASARPSGSWERICGISMKPAEGDRSFQP